jgi:hypothetical protein
MLIQQDFGLTAPAISGVAGDLSFDADEIARPGV